MILIAVLTCILYFHNSTFNSKDFEKVKKKKMILTCMLYLHNSTFNSKDFEKVKEKK